ncbi:MAG: SRPBCC family protein [Terracidiphilus sp.]|jgi:activator of HSP90 ATPase
MNTFPNLLAAATTNRRHVVTGIAATLGAFASAPLAWTQTQQPSMEEKPSNPANQSRTSIHYEIEFHPSPQRLYNAILDQKQFVAFSGLPATIDPTPGGAFSMFGGRIVGRTVELVPNQRIVQAWRPTHWDAGIYSIVHFEFNPRAAETTLIFDHTGFPAGEYDHLDSGWHSHYWEPLKKFLA